MFYEPEWTPSKTISSVHWLKLKNASVHFSLKMTHSGGLLTATRRIKLCHCTESNL